MKNEDIRVQEKYEWLREYFNMAIRQIIKTYFSTKTVFEVSFPVDHFLHLTGVETGLSVKDLYTNAKRIS